MSEEPARQSHLMVWTLSIVGVLVLYILSYGPVVYLIERGTIHADPYPEGLEVSYTPLGWIYSNTPLRRPLDAYLVWWVNAANAEGATFMPPPHPRT